jgi:hypothetical protein
VHVARANPNSQFQFQSNSNIQSHHHHHQCHTHMRIAIAIAHCTLHTRQFPIAICHVDSIKMHFNKNTNAACASGRYRARPFGTAGESKSTRPVPEMKTVATGDHARQPSTVHMTQGDYEPLCLLPTDVALKSIQSVLLAFEIYVHTPVHGSACGCVGLGASMHVCV